MVKQLTSDNTNGIVNVELTFVAAIDIKTNITHRIKLILQSWQQSVKKVPCF